MVIKYHAYTEEEEEENIKRGKQTMALTRLGALTFRAVKKSGLTYRYATHCIASRNFSSTKNENQEDDENKPIKFSTSPAATWKARDTFFTNDDSPWFQPFVVSGSLTVFLLYFLVLREENDIDRLFDRDLYDHVEGLEEQHIREAQQYARQLEAQQAS